MIHDLKPYPAYTDSGVPWLGEVPRHWEVRRLKQVCSRSALYGANVAATSYTATGVRFLRTTDITEDGHLKRGGVFLPHESVLDYLLMDGDLLISRSGTVGRSFLYQSCLHGPCAYAGYLVRFVPGSPVLSRYLCLFTKTQSFAGFLRVMAISSTIENVNGEKYANAPLPLPPLPEQAAIVRFLDHADRRIRRYIRAKQKLIKLLEEQKRAIIHRAVTRGLDPNVRLQPSGVEWLGEVPEHWSIQRTKNLFRLRTQKSGDRHGLELLSIYTHIGVRPRKELEERGNKASTTDDYWIVKKGDIIVNKLLAWMGAVGVSNYDGVTSPAYDILMPIRKLVPEFYHHLFRTKLYLQQFKRRSRGIMDMRLRLYFDQLGQIPLLVPPIEEQSAIVAFYVDATADLDRTIGTAQSEIDLLREYRTRLLADVVTGKLDVRSAAAQLPDEAEEPELLDEADTVTESDEEGEGIQLDEAIAEAEA